MGRRAAKSRAVKASQGLEVSQGHEASQEQRASRGRSLDAAAGRRARIKTRRGVVSRDEEDAVPDVSSRIGPSPAPERRITRLQAKQHQQENTTQPEADAEPEPKTDPEEDSSEVEKGKSRSDSGDGEEQLLKRAELTKENLALFDKMGRQTKGTSSGSATTSKTPPSENESTKTISTSSPGFWFQAKMNGLLDPSRSDPPTNLEKIRKRLAVIRKGDSLPEAVYKEYVTSIRRAKTETEILVEVSENLLIRYRVDGYATRFDKAFTGYPKDVGFNKGLSCPKPDFVQGLELLEFLPFPVKDFVEGGVLYSGDPDSVTLPHIAGELKHIAKDMEQATIQSAYNGAALVYARDQARLALGEPDPPGYAAVVTFATNGKVLELFAHYSTGAQEDGTLRYHQYPVRSFNLMDSHGGFEEGRAALRNEQDAAKRRSYVLRDKLRERWKTQQRAARRGALRSAVPPAEGGDPLSPAASSVAGSPCQPTPAASSPRKRRAPSSTSSSSSRGSLSRQSGRIGGDGGIQKPRAPSALASPRKALAKAGSTPAEKDADGTAV